MRIRNTSRYPDAEVRSLVEFGFKGVADAGVVVNVKNANTAYRGYAYHGIPSRSPVAQLKTACRLVTIGIGTPGYFPQDNMVHARRWKEVSEAEYVALPEAEQKHLRHWHYSDRPARYQREVVAYHPYGGKASPLIVMANWQEGLVGIAAHEGRHVWQFANHKPLSEVDAEKFAAKALARFRAEQEKAA